MPGGCGNDIVTCGSSAGDVVGIPPHHHGDLLGRTGFQHLVPGDDLTSSSDDVATDLALEPRLSLVWGRDAQLG